MGLPKKSCIEPSKRFWCVLGGLLWFCAYPNYISVRHISISTLLFQITKIWSNDFWWSRKKSIFLQFVIPAKVPRPAGLFQWVLDSGWSLSRTWCGAGVTDFGFFTRPLFDIVKSSMKNRSVTYRKTMKTLPLEGLILVHTGHRGCDNSFLQCHVTRL